MKSIVKAVLPKKARSRLQSFAHLAGLRLRSPSASLRILPHFLIVGAQKAGTTSLYKYLLKHQDVLPCLVKEVHFFDLNFYKGLLWYQAHFPRKRALQHKGNGRICGEASPYYMFHPHAMRRIVDCLGSNVRIIVLVRNPIDRAYSHYKHQVRAGREDNSFRRAIELEPSRISEETAKIIADPSYDSYAHRHFSYLARGIYVDQIVRLLAFFPLDRVLILQSERFWSTPDSCFREVLSFLGLQDWRLHRFAKYNVTSGKPMNPHDREFLLHYYHPHNERLYAVLGQRFDWDH